MKQIIFIALSLFILPILGHTAVIKLSTDDEIIATIIEQTDLDIKVKHDVLGELTIAKSNIVSIENDELVSSEKTEIYPVDEGKSIDNGLFGTGILSNWQRSFTLGLNGKQGNSNTFAFHTAFDADYEDIDKRWDFGVYYNFSEENGKSTADDLKVSVTRDWLLPDSQWLYFASGKLDWDKFKSWDYRVTGIAGVGYELIKKENFLLIGRTGIAGRKNVGSDDDNFESELMIGFDTDWAISKVQSFTFKTEFFVPFDQARDFRNLSRLDWKFKLDSLMDLSFKLGLENEYESTVNDGINHNDFKYRAAIVWGI